MKVLYHAKVLRQLMKNTHFEDDFVQRFASHINITYDPARVNGMIDWFEAGIAPEMPAHIARWGQPSSMSSLEVAIAGLRNFGNLRPAVMIDDLDSYLDYRAWLT